MTNLTLRSLDIPSIHKFAVGFDGVLDELMRATSQTTNYPPYNIIKYGPDKFVLELAVAGFKDGDIDVTIDRNQLIVSGGKPTDLDSPNAEYLYRGISSRNFVRTWSLADHVEVTSASVQDGILTLELNRIVPEDQKPKKIAVKFIN